MRLNNHQRRRISLGVKRYVELPKTMTNNAEKRENIRSQKGQTVSQYNTTQHNTTQHNTTQHNTTQHNTIQYSTRQLAGTPQQLKPITVGPFSVYTYNYMQISGMFRNNRPVITLFKLLQD